MALQTLVASAARTSSGNAAIDLAIPAAPGYGSDTEGGVDRLVGAILLLELTAAATDVGDTLDVYIQHSPDGTNWDDFVHFTQALGNGGPKRFLAQWTSRGTPESEAHVFSDGALGAGVLQGPTFGLWRCKWVIVDAGTVNASFTFSVKAELLVSDQ